MPAHIEKFGAKQFAHLIPFVEQAGITHFLLQFVRHCCPALIMPGVASEYLRMRCPVFVDLRRKFDKITRRVGAGKRGITLAGKKAVQRMTKFME